MNVNAKTHIKVMVLAVASAFGAPLYAADAAPTGAVFTGEATAKLYSFDYFKGPGTNGTQFLERYNYQQDMGGDQRGGSYLDLDLNIVGTTAARSRPIPIHWASPVITPISARQPADWVFSTTRTW
jgi:hypothetical protein